MLEIVRVDTPERFHALRRDWNSLLERSPGKTVFLTWEWQYTWWEKYSFEDKIYILLIQDENRQLVGIAPFILCDERFWGLKIRKLKLIGSEEVCSEYLDVFTLGERDTEVVEAVAAHLKSINGFDMIVFKDIPDQSLVSSICSKINDESDFICRTKVQSTNPFIPLPREVKFYHGRLSKSLREELKRKENLLKREHHRVSFITVKDVRKDSEPFSRFVELHQKLWKYRGFPGVFKRVRYSEFHKEVCRRFSETGVLRMYFIHINDEPASGIYGYEYSGKFYDYQTGYDPRWGRYGIGKMLLYYSINISIENGLQEYDFLRGEDNYKYRFTNRKRHTHEIILGKKKKKVIAYLYEKSIKKRIKDTVKAITPGFIREKAKRIRDNIVLR